MPGAGDRMGPEREKDDDCACVILRIGTEETDCSTEGAEAAYCQMDARDPSNVVEASLDVRGVGSLTPRKDK